MSRDPSRLIRLLAVAAVSASPALAWAHPGHEEGFVAAFMHPLLGWDHLLAMLMVGALAARHVGRSGLAVPAGFVGGAAVGALAGLLFPVTSGLSALLEPAILGSVAVLGLALALTRQLPVRAAAAVCGVFGAMHGLAHGIELAGHAAAVLSGLLVATALLHGAGFVAFRASVHRAPWLPRIAAIAASVAALIAVARFA
ncbi:HupE/UreJ family protein [soil metagenome]